MVHALKSSSIKLFMINPIGNLQKSMKRIHKVSSVISFSDAASLHSTTSGEYSQPNASSFFSPLIPLLFPVQSS